MAYNSTTPTATELVFTGSAADVLASLPVPKVGMIRLTLEGFETGAA